MEIKYSLNLIQDHRDALHKNKNKKFHLIILGVVCLLVLAGTVSYSYMQIHDMHVQIERERRYCMKIEQEYKKYQSIKMTVNKADIELLNQLFNKRIFWTKKIAAMAYHLPENYWINEFEYMKESFNVEGGGLISLKQEQLLTLDDYFTKLRKDNNYRDVFPLTRFKSATRVEDKRNKKVNYNFTSLHSGEHKQ